VVPIVLIFTLNVESRLILSQHNLLVGFQVEKSKNEIRFDLTDFTNGGGINIVTILVQNNQVSFYSSHHNL